MDQSRRKRLIEFASLAFVTVIFISSYLTFGNNNLASGTTTTSTVQGGPTFFTAGYANATVTGYGNSAYVRLLNMTNATESAAFNKLSELEGNGSITFNNLNDSFQVYLDGIDAYALQETLVGALGTGNVSVTALVKVRLPGNLTLYYNSAQVGVHLAQLNYTLTMTGVPQSGSIVNVSVHALVTRNGSVYNNMLRLNAT